MPDQMDGRNVDFMAEDSDSMHLSHWCSDVIMARVEEDMGKI